MLANVMMLLKRMQQASLKEPDKLCVSTVGMTKAAKWKEPMGLFKLSQDHSQISRNGLRLASGLAIATLLSACSSGGPAPTTSTSKGKFDPKYGVSASARVAKSKSEFRKGGGHYKIGKPYKVAGKLYRPKHEPGYNKSGKASWYGDDFHGRLTANGEIFDMNTMTAAHPTLPLPSYARVTNLKNGRSVIVRINDRGPYAHNRIIDLSKRVAEVLAFKNDGITNVRVKYIGKARMDGEDARYLEASYRQRGQAIGNDYKAVPKEGQPHRQAAPAPVMMASAAPQTITPTAPRKERSNYLLAHVPTLQASMIAPNPTPAQLSQLANAGWAPIDLVGDGYHPPKAVSQAGGAARPTYKLARLNYAPTFSNARLKQGHEAISSLFDKPTSERNTALKNALADKAKLAAKTARANPSIGTYNPAYAMRLASEFALLAAIDANQQPDGSIKLTIAKLKAGANWQDIEIMRQKLGLSTLR